MIITTVIVNYVSDGTGGCAVVGTASPRATSTSSSPGGPAENGVVVGIVVGAFVLFIATVIGSVVST